MPLLPERHEAEDLVIPLVLAQLGIGVAEDTGLGVLSQEGQDPLLAPAPLGDIVLLDRRVLTVEGDRVEVQVERCPPTQSQATDWIEPAPHQARVATRWDAATVFGEGRSLGDDVQASEESQAVVKDRAHDVAMTCVAEELQGQERPQGARGRDHRGSGEPILLQQGIQLGRDQVGQEEEQAAEVGVDSSRCQVELADVGHIGHDGMKSLRSFVVPTTGQFGEALWLQDRRHRGRAERLTVAGEGTADIVDGAVLLSQGDDQFPQAILLAGRSALTWGRDEEVTLGLAAELMDEDPEAAWGVAEASGRLGGWHTIDEESPQGLVLPMSGVGGFQKALGQS